MLILQQFKHCALQSIPSTGGKPCPKFYSSISTVPFKAVPSTGDTQSPKFYSSISNVPFKAVPPTGDTQSPKFYSSTSTVPFKAVPSTGDTQSPKFYSSTSTVPFKAVPPTGDTQSPKFLPFLECFLERTFCDGEQFSYSIFLKLLCGLETISKIHNTLVLPTFLYRSENWTLLLTQYRAGDKIKKNEMGWACGAYG